MTSEAQTAANPLTHNFTGRKPSKAQVMAQVKRFENQGADFISLTWGENCIDLVLIDDYWHGSGWFKEIGGDWTARELNHCPRKAFARKFDDPVKFMREHFTVVHVK